MQSRVEYQMAFYHILKLRWWYVIIQGWKYYLPDCLGAVSILRCRLASIGIPMLKIRRFRDRPIFNKEIPIPGKTVFILSLSPDYNLPQKVVGLNMGLVLSVASAGFLPPVIPLGCICIQTDSRIQRKLVGTTHYVISRTWLSFRAVPVGVLTKFYRGPNGRG